MQSQDAAVASFDGRCAEDSLSGLCLCRGTFASCPLRLGPVWSDQHLRSHSPSHPPARMAHPPWAAPAGRFKLHRAGRGFWRGSLRLTHWFPQGCFSPSPPAWCWQRSPNYPTSNEWVPPRENHDSTHVNT